VEVGEVDFRVANIMRFDIEGEGPWTLVVMNETIYYLGWLYSFFDVAWLAKRIFEATEEGGRFFMANTFGVAEDPLTLEHIIRTYRDLFLNAGFVVEREEVFRGRKNGVEIDVACALLGK
jgi:hypothetical protein